MAIRVVWIIICQSNSKEVIGEWGKFRSEELQIFYCLSRVTKSRSVETDGGCSIQGRNTNLYKILIRRGNVECRLRSDRILNRPWLNRWRNFKLLRKGTMTDCDHCAEHSDFVMSSCWVRWTLKLFLYFCI